MNKEGCRDKLGHVFDGGHQRPCSKCGWEIPTQEKPKHEMGWEISFNEDVERYIRELKWSTEALDYEKTLVIGNIRGFAEYIKTCLGDLPESALTHQKESIVSKLEGIKRPIDKSLGYDINRYDIGNNDAITDAIKVIRGIDLHK